MQQITKVILSLDKDESLVLGQPNFVHGAYHISNYLEKFHGDVFLYGVWSLSSKMKRAGIQKKEYRVSGKGIYVDGLDLGKNK